MTIQYTPTFKFEGSEAENVRRGISFLHSMVGELSMPDTRRLVSTHVGGSYARFIDLFITRKDRLSLTQEHAEKLIAIANSLCPDAEPQTVRKLRTWFEPLLADMRAADETSKLENRCEQQKPLANAS